MSDPNYNPQPYPSQDQSQYQQPQYGKQQTYEQSQYAQPQSNPYADSQQYAQQPQYGQSQYQQPRYGQPQYQQPQYVQSPYGQQPYMGQQPADTGSFGWAVLGFFFPYRRPHPLPRLEVGEASQRETGGNESASIGHLHSGSMDSAHSVRCNRGERRHLLAPLNCFCRGFSRLLAEA